MAFHLDVLFEDNHLLVVNKPAGVATMGVTADQASLVREAKKYIKRKYRKPGNVYLGVVSRIDSVASGVVVLARTSKAAARLSAQFRSRKVQKTYLAVVAGRVEHSGELVDYLAKDEAQRRMVVVDASAAGGKLAQLVVRPLSDVKSGTLVEIELETGRKHQIRVQLASRGHPVHGDGKYGNRAAFAGQFGPAIALHAYRLGFAHPVRAELLEFTAPVPDTWRRLGVALE